ncbi:hypothetical protein TARUN_7487 [Trichoderma arundinaceum]|uniref:SnoaL-like domain-containing protein n=1 Tax=Trichoderma arundinaceum TaxID=490622 RepID=A0A395NF50_TRIAR|nr:hypothetical protein TARUN_7487 [Trichoderma arundinaceum]
MAPPNAVIREMLEAQMLHQIHPEYELPKGGPGTLIDNVSDDVFFQIVTEHPELARSVNGRQAVLDVTKNVMHQIVDHNEDIKTEIVHLIGGGDSPWLAAVLRQVTKSKVGDVFTHEWVVIFEFNNQDKIKTLKIYPDAHTVQEHAGKHDLDL